MNFQETNNESYTIAINKLSKIGISTSTSKQNLTRVIYSRLDNDKLSSSIIIKNNTLPKKVTNSIAKQSNKVLLKQENKSTPLYSLSSNEIDYKIKQEIKSDIYNDSISLALTIQYAESWGLDRIDQRNNTLNEEYKYKYTGKGVHVYVIDSGIRNDHNEFRSRIGNGIDFVYNDDIAEDNCNGHGTYVAGIIAGTNYGVANEAIIHPIRVSNCEGTSSRIKIYSAIDWILENHKKPAVVNMSMGENTVNIIIMQLEN
jgi:subtilisin family serine protease